MSEKGEMTGRDLQVDAGLVTPKPFTGEELLQLGAEEVLFAMHEHDGDPIQDARHLPVARLSWRDSWISVDLTIKDSENASSGLEEKGSIIDTKFSSNS